MKNQEREFSISQDAEFHIAFGWLTAVSIAIASIATVS